MKSLAQTRPAQTPETNSTGLLRSDDQRPEAIAQRQRQSLLTASAVEATHGARQALMQQKTMLHEPENHALDLYTNPAEQMTPDHVRPTTREAAPLQRQIVSVVQRSKGVKRSREQAFGNSGYDEEPPYKRARFETSGEDEELPEDDELMEVFPYPAITWFEQQVADNPEQIERFETFKEVLASAGFLRELNNMLEPYVGNPINAGATLSSIEGRLAQSPLIGEAFRIETASPQERGWMAAEEIQKAVASGEYPDTAALQQEFPFFRRKYRMRSIQYIWREGLPSVAFQINPHFEVNLTGGHAIEMRSVGSSSGNTQTRVQWTPQTLALTTSSQPGGGSYTVGKHMRAFPLTQDHPPGSKADADSDHLGMMGKLPSAGSRAKTGSGSGPYYYIRGHLLNDHLGGIANEANLYPITHEANGQHKNCVEQYIKTGLAQGYVYRYEVFVKTVGVEDETAYGGYAVNADLNFSFARLDTAQKDVPGTAHSGTIKSRYKSQEADPFDKSTEYATDYGGSYNSPKPIGGEDSYKATKEEGIRTTNTGLVSNVPKFTYVTPSGSALLGSSQSINTSASLIPTGQALSLIQSKQTSVENYFQTLVTGWTATDVTQWVNDVRSTKFSRWADVWSHAVKNNKLEQSIADEVQKKYLIRVTINGTPKGT